MGRVLRERVADQRKFRAQFFERFRFGTLHAERDAHGRSHADGWGAANDHRLDGFGDVAIIRVGVMDDFRGQLQLVENDDACGSPLNGFDRVQRFHLRYWRASECCAQISIVADFRGFIAG